MLNSQENHELMNYEQYVQKIIKAPSKAYNALTGIKIDGYEGTWKSVSEYIVETSDGEEKFYLMEHEQNPTYYYNTILNYQLVLVAEDIEM